MPLPIEPPEETFLVTASQLDRVLIDLWQAGWDTGYIEAETTKLPSRLWQVAGDVDKATKKLTGYGAFVRARS